LRVFQLVNSFKIQFLRHKKPDFINAKAFRFTIKILGNFNLQTVLKQIFLGFKTCLKAKIRQTLIAFPQLNLPANNFTFLAFRQAKAD
jgi:hypothetical protein